MDAKATRQICCDLPPYLRGIQPTLVKTCSGRKALPTRHIKNMPENKKRILLIEDDDVDREAVHRLIGDAFEVIDASAGHHARKLLHQQSFDCVLLDFRLPDMEGLRLVPELRGVPWVLLTRVGNEQVAVQAMKDGASDYLRKQDLTKDALEGAVGRAIIKDADPLRPITILNADDNQDDRLFLKMALDRARFENDARFVCDGAELMDYLYRRDSFGDPSSSPRPDLIFLDLNMPGMSGHEALERIKQDDDLRNIPVIVLTTSSAEEDVTESHRLGAIGYISKPIGIEGLSSALELVGRVFQTVKATDGG